MPQKYILTRNELGAQLGVSPATITRWKNMGCPYHETKNGLKRTGSRPRYSLPAVLAWLESRTAGTAGKEAEA